MKVINSTRLLLLKQVMYMKKIILILLSVILCLSLFGCKGGQDSAFSGDMIDNGIWEGVVVY